MKPGMVSRGQPFEPRAGPILFRTVFISADPIPPDQMSRADSFSPMLARELLRSPQRPKAGKPSAKRSECVCPWKRLCFGWALEKRSEGWSRTRQESLFLGYGSLLKFSTGLVINRERQFLPATMAVLL